VIELDGSATSRTSWSRSATPATMGGGIETFRYSVKRTDG
jgi:hypothetical protein